MQRASVLLSALVAALLATAVPASAEWFTDFYLGAAKTQQADVTFTTFDQDVRQDLNNSSSLSVGVRGGRWFDDLPWLGFAVDASYFSPATDITVFPITALLMARYGFLKDDEFKEGRLQPYAGIGGGLFISHVNGSVGFQESSDTSADIGLDLRAGVAHGFYASDTMKVFGFLEYRFTHVAPTFDVSTFGGTTSAETTFNTHHFVLGVSVRF